MMQLQLLAHWMMKKKLVLSKISRKERTFIEDNLSYDENTAGRLMQLELVRIPVHFNVGDVIDYLRKKRTLPKVFYDLYIVDKKSKISRDNRIECHNIILKKCNNK